ncbi:hypothetical protein DSL72_008617 [Monilinia vaccinii-corymbosi]|uniref:Uncharacterized protein n=1 Tax=Monilinia vaccinii-corymbosi TaxID=61207 RepID=A0A8A3PRL3_9HELO|nr:hypothetical protein DSL72_008617 [Monilinia vaccinii-corymbosi]
MVKKRDDDSVSTAVVTPQTSEHSINPNTTSKEVTLDTPPTSPAVEKEKRDLDSANPPRHYMGGEPPYATSDPRGVLAISALMGHFLSDDYDWEEVEGEKVDASRDGAWQRRTNALVQSHDHVTYVSALSEDQDGVKSEGEGVDDPRDAHAVSSRRAGFGVRLVSNGCDGASTTSSTSSGGLGVLQGTPSSSSVDDDDDDDDDDDGADDMHMEEDLIDLHSDSCSPSLRIGPDLKSSHHHHHRSPNPLPIKPKSSKQAKAPAALRQETHHRLSSPIPTCPPGSIPKHEIFLHTLPAKDASVADVRSWIASWFLGRDIAFEVPRAGVDVDIGMRQYIDCISWSGDDVHRVWPASLELDLRGWMLGGYARPIVRDIERARGMERERVWRLFWGRMGDFLAGVLVMAAVGLFWVHFLPVPMLMLWESC